MMCILYTVDAQLVLFFPFKNEIKKWEAVTETKQSLSVWLGCTLSPKRQIFWNKKGLTEIICEWILLWILACVGRLLIIS